MRSKITYIYSFALKVSTVSTTISLLVIFALILDSQTDMSGMTKYTVVGIAWLVILYVTSRKFRTTAEGNAPRPWWRMTVSPFLGWVLAIFFAAMGIGIATGNDLLPSNPLLGMVYVMFGSLFVVNALRPPARRR